MQEPLIYIVFIVMMPGELQSILQIDGSMNISVFSFVAVAESQTVKTTESLKRKFSGDTGASKSTSCVILEDSFPLQTCMLPQAK